ncbi:hypothetical protein LshimejAT787_2300380 [Lyophyllum shimeji]|uniref:Uncharacterized protein n=1 Tax=Lyophyllum shimeji TaxID=47721 RepID=A0A9P3Q0N4_LYOSH|nr:hypothetical protein LshimejAT787_2300380 [Lyophyllum shimeji]
MRDVFSPHITSPNEKSVWPVGTKQTVTWETDNIPPDSQLTNPNGKVVLGHLGPTGGLNLMLDNPLAQDFKLRVGQVEITVPDVPPRSDYIVVLFGDSGNASPAFAITSITGGGNSTTTTGSSQTTRSSSTTSSVSTPITQPIPITGSTITGGDQPSTTVSLPSSIPSVSPTSTQTASSTSQTTLGTATRAPDTTTTNAASPLRHLSSIQTLSSVGVASFLLTLLI